MAAMLFPRDAIDDGAPNPRGKTLVVVNIILVIISSFLVAARWATRITIHRKLGSDDYAILGALPIAITMTVLFQQEVKNGFGLHKSQVDKTHLHRALKYFYAAQIFYKAAVGLTKSSLLLLYLRIFNGRKFCIAVWVTMFIVVGSAISTIAATIWQCTPIHKAWNSSIPGHCVFIGGIWYSASSLAIFTDVLIIILPLTQLPSLKLPKSQKVGLGLIFSLGVFIIMTTVVRIATLGPAVTAQDTPFAQAENNLWLGIEVNTSIIVTCLPPLRNLFTTFFPRLFKSSNNASSNPTYDIHGPPRTLRNASSHQYTSSRTIGGSQTGAYIVRSQAGRPAPSTDRDSDEEFMLDNFGHGGITKKTDVAVSYNSVEEGSPTRGVAITETKQVVR